MIVYRIILLLMMNHFVISTYADDYDPNNYRPDNSNIKIEETNLPIVFIDTRYGTEHTQVIHKDYAIAARMKIISNADRVNYSDTLTHPDQAIDYEGWIAVKYRGNTSFSASKKKPFSIRTLETKDVNGKKQKVEIMGMPKDNKWAMLAPYNDRSLIRDVLMFQLARSYFDYVPRARHCEVIVDGYYYGIYVMCEKPSKGKHRLNLDDPGTQGDELTGGYQLEIDRDDEPHFFRSKHVLKTENGIPYTYNNRIVFQYKHPDYDDMIPEHAEQLEYIQRQIDLMEEALDSDDFTDPERGYRRYLDPISFIDQQLSQEVSGNIDGYRLSTNIYKQRDSQNPLFKTTLWDFNLAFGNAMQMGGYLTDYWVYQNTYVPAYDYKVPFWWSRMMEDPWYVDQLKKRWHQYRQGAYSNNHIEETIDSLVNHLKERGALERNNRTYDMFGSEWIWPVPNFESVNTYEKEIDNMKRWLNERIAWMDKQLDYHPSAVSQLTTDLNKEIDGYYSLQGTKLGTPYNKGIVIIRYKDGSTHKVLKR